MKEKKRDKPIPSSIFMATTKWPCGWMMDDINNEMQ
jgi:hypothetical protein